MHGDDTTIPVDGAKLRAGASLVRRAPWLLLFALACDTPESAAQGEAPLATGPEVEATEVEAPDGSAAPRASGRTRVVLLGTGTPSADPRRSGPATAVVVDDHAYLVDAGPGVVRRAVAANENGVRGLALTGLSRVFLTHLHSDHTLGLPDLWLSPWVLGRDEPLHVHGPPGTRAMVEALGAAWAEDVRIRTEGLEDSDPAGARVVTLEVQPGVAHRDEWVTVRAFSVPHGSFRHSFGYRFEGPERVIVVSGDTGPSDAVVRACDGCDVLVHEVYAGSRLARRGEAAQAYHRSFHTSAQELGELAARARPRLLVLTHQLAWGASEAEVIAEVRAGFDGEVAYGHDLDVF